MSAAISLKPLAAALLLCAAASAQATIDATDVSLDCSDALSINDVDDLVVRCSGDLRVSGAGLDPNRVSEVLTTPGGELMAMGFQASGSITGSRFGTNVRLSAGSSSITGQVSGAFSGLTEAPRGIVDVARPGVVGTPDASRYIAPFLLAQASTASLSPVPEPTTWALLLGGISALGFLRRRRA